MAGQLLVLAQLGLDNDGPAPDMQRPSLADHVAIAHRADHVCRRGDRRRPGAGRGTAVEHATARAQIGGPRQASYYALGSREVELDIEPDGEWHQVQQLAGIVDWITTL